MVVGSFVWTPRLPYPGTVAEYRERERYPLRGEDTVTPPDRIWLWRTEILSWWRRWSIEWSLLSVFDWPVIASKTRYCSFRLACMTVSRCDRSVESFSWWSMRVLWYDAGKAITAITDRPYRAYRLLYQSAYHPGYSMTSCNVALTFCIHPSIPFLLRYSLSRILSLPRTGYRVLCNSWPYVPLPCPKLFCLITWKQGAGPLRHSPCFAWFCHLEANLGTRCTGLYYFQLFFPIPFSYSPWGISWGYLGKDPLPLPPKSSFITESGELSTKTRVPNCHIIHQTTDSGTHLLQYFLVLFETSFPKQ